MFLSDTGLVYRGIRPLQKLGTLTLGTALSGLSFPARVPDQLNVVPTDPWSGDAQKGRDLISGIFTFAGQTFARDDLSWAPEKATQAWLAELHSFGWLRDLRSVGGERARRMAREMVASWLETHQKPSKDAWRPDVTGSRICAWISFHDFFCCTAEDDFRHKYFESLSRQARYLQKSLPLKINGVASLRALKGLAYAGLALGQDQEQLELAFTHILKQIRDEIMPDGGHISRSPQGTFDFLQLLVDLRTALTAARMPIPDELQHAIDRIVPAVKFFRHGDGGFALFNGGQEGNANICDATLMHSGAKGKAMRALPHAGYDRIALGRSTLIMDVGQSLSSGYSDRAHAGLLSFEYSFGKDRVFVNCGTVEAEGLWREVLRGTAAHTTMTVDQRNALAIDGSTTIHQPDIRSKKQDDGDIAMIEASHNGYMPRYGLGYRRCVRLADGGDVLLGDEVLTGRSGIEFALRFHLHPSMRASVIENGHGVMLQARSGIGWTFRCDGARPVLEESVYAAQGETPRHSLQISLQGRTSSQATALSWSLRRS
jgi:uncharacterized heparinase superfamily protein